MTEETATPHYCIGCGAQIQTVDKTAAGYIPASALKKNLAAEDVYCQRCFRLRHYNEISDVRLSDDDFLRLLTQLSEADALIVNVIDIFDFNGSLIPGLHRFVGDNPVLLVGNKVDVLPKSVKRGKVKQWLQQQAHAAGLRPVDVLLTSAKNGYQLDDLLKAIDHYRAGRDVYVVGVTNVGKSTLINRIIKQATGTQNLITTSRFPGTTLDKIEIPLADGQQLIDTPGIIHHQQMAHYLGQQDLKLVAPKKPIKPKTYQLDSGQTLFLGGVGRFDYEQGPHSGFTLYFDNNLYIHRTKLSNATDFYQRQLGKLLQPPRPEEVAALPALKRIQFTPEEKSDVVFAGLGWITVPAGATVSGWAPEGVAVTLRTALI